MRFHLDHLIEEGIAQGLQPHEARNAALRAMGGLEQRKEEARDGAAWCALSSRCVRVGTTSSGAEHPRQGRERIVIDPRHYEGEATADVLPPLPLGRMGR